MLQRQQRQQQHVAAATAFVLHYSPGACSSAGLFADITLSLSMTHLDLRSDCASYPSPPPKKPPPPPTPTPTAPVTRGTPQKEAAAAGAGGQGKSERSNAFRWGVTWGGLHGERLHGRLHGGGAGAHVEIDNAPCTLHHPAINTL